MSMPHDRGPLQSSIDRVSGELDRFVESFRERSGRALDAVGIKGGRPEFPAIDVTETNDAVHVIADLPGVDSDLLDLRVTGGSLTLRGSVARPPLGQGGTISRSERHVGSFDRTVPLPAEVNADAATADLRHGVLHARLPKASHEVGRKIAVRLDPTTPGDSVTSGLPPQSM